MAPGEDPTTVYNAIMSASNTNIPGLGTVATSATVQGFTPSDQSSSTNLGLILGVSIPLGILFIVIIAVVIYKVKSDSSNSEDEKGKQVGQESVGNMKSSGVI